jgi:hypothetical protein
MNLGNGGIGNAANLFQLSLLGFRIGLDQDRIEKCTCTVPISESLRSIEILWAGT